jgi:excisionase family DNA binding protein
VREREKTGKAIENILRLRRAERLADSHLRAEIATAREFLEGLVGPTVRPADAARLLGVSQPALLRWTEKGEISSVMTPQGRREIPLSELVGLLDEIELVRDEATGRPLARVVRNRRRRAEEAVDLDRLLPRRRRRGHRTAELQALAYHRLVAERLDERIVDEARRRLRRWRASGRVHPRWIEEWERVLAMPLPQIAKTIGADTRHARELRQTSPFAGVLSEHERRRLTKAVEERALA